MARNRPGKEDGQWRQQSNLLRQALPFSDKKKASTPWSGIARLQGLSSTPRVKELLDCAYLHAEARAQQEGKAFDVNSLIADCSQAISRKPWSLDETRTFCTSTQNYSFKVDRVILPEEELSMLGFPGGLLRGIRLSDGFEFVGQSMALPSVAMAEAALMVACIKTGALSNVVRLKDDHQGA